MIENDVKTSVKNQNGTWFLYQAINERKQNQFDEFISKGGENKEFANLVFLTVMISETTQGFKGFDFTDINVFESRKKGMRILTHTFLKNHFLTYISSRIHTVLWQSQNPYPG